MRVVAHVVVAEGEPRLAAVLERAQWWSNELSVVLDPSTGEEEKETALAWSDHVGFSKIGMDEHEGDARTAAWHLMSEMVEASESDYIFALEPWEVLANHDALRPWLKWRAGEQAFEAHSIQVHYMWDDGHYRIDGLFAPKNEWAVVPWRQGGRMRSRRTRSGREPTYVMGDDQSIRTYNSPFAVLSYLWASAEDRARVAGSYRETWQAVEPPSLVPWIEGGLL